MTFLVKKENFIQQMFCGTKPLTKKSPSLLRPPSVYEKIFPFIFCHSTSLSLKFIVYRIYLEIFF